MLTIAATPMISRITAVIRVNESGKMALAVDQPSARIASQSAEPEHELNVVDDTEHQHDDAERDQRHAEVARRCGPRENILSLSFWKT